MKSSIGIWRINQYIGGTEVSLIEMARFLMLAGHEVWVYGSNNCIGLLAHELGVTVSPEEELFKHQHDILLWFDEYARFKQMCSPDYAEHIIKIPLRYGVYGGVGAIKFIKSPLCDRAIAKTDEIVAQLAEHGVTVDKVSQFPIDLSYWHSDKRQSTGIPVVGYIGRTENKNIGQLVDIAKVTGNCRVKLVISDRIVTENIETFGCEVVRNDPLMKPHYQSFDVFSMTSLIEGIPRTLMEAMAMSLPVVVWNVGGMAKLGARCGFAPGSFAKAVSAMRLFVSDKDARLEAGIYNRDKIEQYDSAIRQDLTEWFGSLH